MDHNSDIDFIARRYRKGLFDVEQALRRVRPAARRWTMSRVAAAAAVVVVLSATAAVIIDRHYSVDRDDATEVVTPAAETVAPRDIVRVIDFEEAPLPVVVDRIKETYSVDVTGLPDDADSYRLSLHYEGTADDLVETINEILGTEMTIDAR